jgi:hypothetical protein
MCPQTIEPVVFFMDSREGLLHFEVERLVITIHYSRPDMAYCIHTKVLLAGQPKGAFEAAVRHRSELRGRCRDDYARRHASDRHRPRSHRIPVGWFCVRYIESQLYESKVMSFGVLTIATLTLTAAAAAAGLIPAQCAASTNPSQALRAE